MTLVPFYGALVRFLKMMKKSYTVKLDSVTAQSEAGIMDIDK